MAEEANAAAAAAAVVVAPHGLSHAQVRLSGCRPAARVHVGEELRNGTACVAPVHTQAAFFMAYATVLFLWLLSEYCQ